MCQTCYAEGLYGRTVLKSSLQHRLEEQGCGSSSWQGAAWSACGAGETPDASCPNPQCARPYHARCLREWLLSVSTSRKSFGVIFGECPYCSSPITVMMR